MLLLIKMIFLFNFILMMLLILLNKIYSFNLNFNNSNSIECGFNSFNNNHMPMNNNFFIVMIIFMIFDLEFFLLIPMIFLMKNFNWMKFMTMINLIYLFMFYSMIYEIKFNSIKWIN